MCNFCFGLTRNYPSCSLLQTPAGVTPREKKPRDPLQLSVLFMAPHLPLPLRPPSTRLNVWARVHRRAARRYVLTNPELLELVLVHLDNAALLRSAPLVCRLWRDVIAASPRLQELIVKYKRIEAELMRYQSDRFYCVLPDVDDEDL